MSASNYPNGINNLVLRGIPITMTHPGRVFYVSNADVLYEHGQRLAGANSGDEGTLSRPFRTLDYAVGKCKANRGDIIMVMPGHAETYSQATATADDLTFDVAGIAVIGMGSGSLRPTFTQDTETTQTIAVTAANVTLYNLYFKSNVQDLAIAITLTTAKYFSLVKCQFDDTSNALNYLNVVESTGIANTIDGLLVEGCIYNGLDATFNTFCVVAAAQDDMKFIGNRAWTTATSAEPVLLDLTGDSTHLWMSKNSVSTLATTNVNILVKSSGTSGTGFLNDNFCASLDTTGVSFTVASGFRASTMYHGGVEATQAGLVDPAQDT